MHHIFILLKPNLFGFMKSVDILVIVVLGGLGSISGSVIAAVLLAVLTTYLQKFTEVRMIIYSLLLIAIMLFRPQGLLGTKEITEMFKFNNKLKKIELKIKQPSGICPFNSRKVCWVCWDQMVQERLP